MRIADFGLRMRIAGRSGARRSQDMGNTDHFTIPKRLLPRASIQLMPNPAIEFRNA